MKFSVDRFVVSTLLLCAVSAYADVSADSIMFRRRPSSAASRPMAQERGARPVAAETVEAPRPEVKPQGAAAEVRSSDPMPAKPADVAVEKAASEPAASDGKSAEESKAKKENAPRRDAIITADRTDYDRKEGVVLFDRNVYVDDEQYQMHTDRLFLFLDGTNDLKRLVAIGNVAITNENRRAYCARATFNRKLGRIVMYSSDEITAELREEGNKGSEVKGEKITFWIDSEQVEVENPVITMPGGFGGKDSLKKAMGR